MSYHLITCQLSGADTAIHRLVHHIYILRPNFGKRAAIYTDADALNHTSALTFSDYLHVKKFIVCSPTLKIREGLH